MEVLIYKNQEGQQIEFSRNSNFRLLGKTGFETPENHVESQPYYSADGELYIGSRLNKRDMTIQGAVIPEHNPYNHEDLLELRREMIRIMNPKKAGTLIYQNDIGEYQIDCIPITSPVFDEANKSYKLPFLIQLVALDPHWIDTTYLEQLIRLSRTINMFEFPLEITSDFEFATLESGSIEKVHNYGEVDVGAVFIMRCHSQAKNPRIYNVLTQEYFGFEGTFEAGTKFVIDTRAGKKNVTKEFDGIVENAMPLRLKGSTFLILKTGDNYLQVQTDDENVNGVLVSLNMQPLVVGV